MTEAVLAWIFLLIGLITRNPDWVKASALYAVAAYANGIYKKIGGADNE